jgi:type IV secretion system protein VirD4
MSLRDDLKEFQKDLKGFWLEFKSLIRHLRDAARQAYDDLQRPAQKNVASDVPPSTEEPQRGDGGIAASAEQFEETNDVYDTEDHISQSNTFRREWKKLVFAAIYDAWLRIKPFLFWYIKAYFKIAIKIIKFILWPFRQIFPYKLKDLFYYDFEDLFFNKDYWRELIQIALSQLDLTEFPYKLFLFILCMISPVAMGSALMGYMMAYGALGMMQANIKPILNGHPRPLFVAMICGAMIPLYISIAYGAVGAVILPIYLIGLIFISYTQLKEFAVDLPSKLEFFWNQHWFANQIIHNIHVPQILKAIGCIIFFFGVLFVLPIVIITVIVTWIIASYAIYKVEWLVFENWRESVEQYFFDIAKYGTAKFATDEDIERSVTSGPDAKGLYIGNGKYYEKSGHLLTVAGTRGGKGVNLIIPNLTKIGKFDGSFLVVDPKGENAAITARIQKEQLGRNVIVLNPWNLKVDEYPHLKGSCYNPLDLLSDPAHPDFVDDASIIAEMIVPINKHGGGGGDSFWTDRARSIVAGYIMYIAAHCPKDKRNLFYLYELLRVSGEALDKLLNDMGASEIAAIRNMADEIELMRDSEKMYSSIMSHVFSSTEFVKSPPLAQSLQSTDFNIGDLTDGNTIIYVIIPADKLATHKQWLRLVVTTALRTVIRKPNKDVCFLLDEYYALDYISEIDIALGTYAGYGVHIWAILQNLNQLVDMHGRHWEGFISSCSVRHFFNVSDNFTTEYLSTMFGQTTHAIYNKLGFVKGAQGRRLINPDELRVASDKEMFVVIDQNHPIRFPKMPYYTMADMEEGQDYDRNPYQRQK